MMRFQLDKSKNILKAGNKLSDKLSIKSQGLYYLCINGSFIFFK